MDVESLSSLIDGIFVDSVDDRVVPVVNPSTGRTILNIPTSCAEDVDRAVSAARRAYDSGAWRDRPPSQRKRILHRLADLIQDHAQALDAMDAQEMGKPVRLTFGNAHAAAEWVRFHAEALDKHGGEVLVSAKGSFVAHRLVPRGVVAGIVPWNFPTFNAALKLGPALAAGNAVIIKPSELASRSALRLGSLALEAGVPPGTVNVVLGSGPTAGAGLALHPDVDMVAFTGSSGVGRRMLEYSGQSNMKALLLECGGKSPHILFDDGVDIEAACRAVAEGILTNQGQLCSVGSRILVQWEIAGAVMSKIGGYLKDVTIGDASDLSTTFGPLASKSQHMKVMAHVERAVLEDRAVIKAGGRAVLKESGGYFFEPTLVTGVTARSPTAQEELFGPVLTCLAFKDEEEAVRIANGTRFGLAAYVWTGDLSRAMRMASAIRSPVFINAAPPQGEGAGFAATFDPFKESGCGAEGGVVGLHNYMHRQLVWINYR